jgi:uncharacterized protein (DUF2141 family)
MNRLKLWLMMACIALLAGCAQVRSVSGGTKDTQPPRVLDVTPDSLSVWFNQSSFEVTFDEYVQLRNVQQELLVSPPLKKSPHVQLKQRTLAVSWDDTLRANTTYTFQFGSSISDLNEGNPLADFAYVFSTGSTVDSLRCKGSVKDALLDAPAAKTKVLLYETVDALWDKDARPSYFSRTDDQGKFELQYLRPGIYTLCCLSDENGNYHWDSGEAVVWKDTVKVDAESDSSLLRLMLSVPHDTIPVIKEYTTDSLGGFRCYVAPHLLPVNVRSLEGADIHQWMRSDTLFVSPAFAATGKLRYEVDLGPSKRDTVEVNAYGAERAFVRLKSAVAAKQRQSDALLLDADCFVARFDSTLIELYTDSVSVPFSASLTHPDRLEIRHERKQGSAYECIVMPGALTDSYGKMNDTLRMKFSVYEAKDLGAVRVKLPLLKGGGVFELKDRGGRVVWSSTDFSSGELFIQGLLPGEYSAFITEDANANGRFDPVLFSPFQPTEVNHMYPGKISVRANWDVTLDWPSW